MAQRDDLDERADHGMPSKGQLVNEFYVGRTYASGDFERLTLPARTLKAPGRWRNGAGVDQTRVSSEIARCLGPAGATQVGRSSADHKVSRCQASGNQTRFLQFTDANRQVEAPAGCRGRSSRNT